MSTTHAPAPCAFFTLTDLVAGVDLEAFAEGDHEAGNDRDNEAVAEVAKHDGKEEGEGHQRERRRVDLAVGGHTVRVDDELEDKRKYTRM